MVIFRDTEIDISFIVGMKNSAFVKLHDKYIHIYNW